MKFSKSQRIICNSGSIPGAVIGSFRQSAADALSILEQRDRIAIAPEAIARAIDEPADVDVNEIVVCPTAEG
jgi:hypothetical protein